MTAQFLFGIYAIFGYWRIEKFGLCETESDGAEGEKDGHDGIGRFLEVGEPSAHPAAGEQPYKVCHRPCDGKDIAHDEQVDKAVGVWQHED